MIRTKFHHFPTVRLTKRGSHTVAPLRDLHRDLHRDLLYTDMKDTFSAAAAVTLIILMIIFIST